jgi:hypothetical protein
MLEYLGEYLGKYLVQAQAGVMAEIPNDICVKIQSPLETILLNHG